MAWIEERSGGYLVRWRDGQGRKRQRHFGDRAEAVSFANQPDPRPTARTRGACVTLSEYMLSALETAEDLRDSTRYNYLGVARKHIVPSVGIRRLDAITSEDLRELFARMRSAGFSSSYRAVARDVLSRTFRLAAAEGMVLRNPLDAVPYPRQERRDEVRALDVHEIERLAGAILPRYRAVVLVMAYAGLRVGEVGGLTINHVNLLTNELRIASAVARAGGHLIVSAPKTAAGRRTVPLPSFLAQEMRAHVEHFGLAGDGRLFHTPFVNQHSDKFGLLHAGSLHRPFKKAREQVGLPGVHPHCLRHSYAALLIREGAHPKVLQALMGHASIRVTLDLYGHLLPGLGQDFACRLNDMRGHLLHVQDLVDGGRS